MSNRQNTLELVVAKKSATLDAARQFAHNLTFVPSQHEQTKPSPTAKSALEIWAHCSTANESFAALISHGAYGAYPLDGDGMAWFQEYESGLTTRAEIERAWAASLANLSAAFDSVTEDSIDSIAKDPFGLNRTVEFWMEIATQHLTGHNRQIDYLQTIWGDLDFHKLPEGQ